MYHVPTPPADAYPEAERQRAYAQQDAQRIGPAWGLQAGIEVSPDNDGGDLQANAARRERLGHYLPAVWQFNGEWFWALDRLDMLEQRLRDQDLIAGDEPIARFDAGKADLPSITGDTLEFFFSFRSPYSYLAAERVRESHKELGCDLHIRPVLPMAMRGFVIPKAKRMYIVRDVYRLAQQQGRSFGLIADPVGAGAERCLKTFTIAKGVEQQLDFLVSASRGVWAQGIDVATDKGLRLVSERAGLEWSAVQAVVAKGDLSQAEENRQALFDAGLWGVPGYCIGDFATWGQDRFWMIGQVLKGRSMI